MSDRYRIDGQKIIYHPQRVADLVAAVDRWPLAQHCYPIYVEISPIGACNHRCTFCAVDYLGYAPLRLDASLLGRQLQEMGRLGVKSVMFAGEGEPLLHTEINQMVVAAAAAGIDVSFTTNATVIPDQFMESALPHISWIKASVNGGTAESYAAIHQTKRGDFAKVVENLRQLVAYRNRQQLQCVIGAQLLLLPENRDEVVALARLCRDEIGLDYLVVKPYSQHGFSLTQRYAAIDYSADLALGEALQAESDGRFKTIFRTQAMRKQSGEVGERYSRCYSTPMLWAYLKADGELYSCSAYLGDPRFALGNVMEEGFATVWQGEKRAENYRLLAEELDITHCRQNCRMDEINRYLDQLIGESVPHVNFI
ncbi:MAG: radical SAM protein [Gammaproteobacteria bacterium]|nr:radical SAM protein [Gammaproteobacteria bacterium]